VVEVSYTLNGNSNGGGPNGAGGPGDLGGEVGGDLSGGGIGGGPTGEAVGRAAVGGDLIGGDVIGGDVIGGDPAGGEGAGGGGAAVDEELAGALLGEPPPAEEPRRRWSRRVVAILAVAALVSAGLVVWRGYEHRRPQGYAFPIHTTSDGNGIMISSGRVKVDVYVDFNCPRCKEFQASAAGTLDQLLAARKIALSYHPIAILDQSSSPPGYSTQAATASACAADGGKFLDFTKAMFALQPAQNGPGLPDDQLIQIGAWVGLIDPEFAHCVRHGKYREWVAHATDAARNKGVGGTPTVLVDGHTLAAPSGDSLLAAVRAAGG
jgi:protein-disulfide isomerase